MDNVDVIMDGCEDIGIVDFNVLVLYIVGVD